jgi:hypothetical protein
MEYKPTQKQKDVSQKRLLNRLHPPLEEVQQPLLDTKSAAYYLMAQAQTMRCWAARGVGPIRPVKIGGRLRWRTSEVKKLVGIA